MKASSLLKSDLETEEYFEIGGALNHEFFKREKKRDSPIENAGKVKVKKHSSYRSDDRFRDTRFIIIKLDFIYGDFEKRCGWISDRKWRVNVRRDGHGRREEKIQVEMEMGVAVVGKPPTPPPLLNGLRAGYPTVAPSSEIYAESWVNRPGQSAL